MNDDRTHCTNGHEFTPGNTYINGRQRKVCKLCRKLSQRKYMFGGNREEIILRDGEKCVRCGMTRAQHQAEFGRDITVDHKDDNGAYRPKHLKNNAMDNLQTLCIPCHSSKDNRSKKLSDVQVINIRHAEGAIRPARLAKLYGINGTYVSQLWRKEWRISES